jgi:leucyl aminopeptidase
MDITFAKPGVPTTGALAVAVFEESRLSSVAAAIDRKTKGALSRAMEASRFAGKRNQTLSLLAPDGLKLGRIILIGLGKEAEVDGLGLEAAGGRVISRLRASGQQIAAIHIDRPKGSNIKPAEVAARIAFGAKLASYRFDRYRTTLKAEKKPSLKRISVMCRETAEARRAYARLGKIADGVFFTRDLVSEPANIMYPESLAKEARKLTKLGVKVEVLGRDRMKKLGMGALLGVAQGSARKPQLVIMRWDGASPRAKEKRPIAFVGKGVTFDSGGISLKPSGGMEDMKWDMAGSAAVIGLMSALAGRRARVNAVGIVGLVENMPSSTAQHPGDVVRSMSGQTVEVINTDAEGRLVLADALWYTQQRFKPRMLIDVATLTGAIIVALGHGYAGLFANDDKTARQLEEAGQQTGELLWRMPLNDLYEKDIESSIADMKNVGAGRWGGAISAAQFLQRFVKDVPWAHIDIAGMAWSTKDAPTVPRGGTGYGVRLLDRLVADHYEE